MSINEIETRKSFRLSSNTDQESLSEIGHNNNSNNHQVATLNQQHEIDEKVSRRNRFNWRKV